MTKKLSYLLFFIALVCQSQESKTLIFEEQFDSTTLNEAHWNYELGNGCPNLCGWGNNERQFYTKENSKLRDGNLVITATKEDSIYKSSRITTKDKIEFQYGTIEVRAKLPLGHGLWPAIWMLGHDISDIGWPACGEIDIMEYVGKAPHEVHTTLHTLDSYGKSVNKKLRQTRLLKKDFTFINPIGQKIKLNFS